jgi:hypothetical protein
MRLPLGLILALALFQVHYVTPEGGGHSIVIQASSSSDAGDTVTRMFPGSYTDGVWRVH